MFLLQMKGELRKDDFKNGNYFSLISSKSNNFQMQFSERVKFLITFIDKKNDIDSIKIEKFRKLKDGWKVDKIEGITISKFNFKKLLSLLEFLKENGPKNIKNKQFKLTDKLIEELDEKTRKKIIKFFTNEEKLKLVEEFLSGKEGIDSIKSKDLVNLGYRKNQLKIFHGLLYDKNYFNQYKNWFNKNKKSETKDESIWQYFFSKNHWIFGYGLDYKFQGILQKEFHASNSDADGKNEVVCDYLLGDKRFTTFIEIKKPDTPLFGISKNRSNCWKLSGDIFDSVSQILERKASGQIKIETTGNLYNNENDKIKQKSYDSKVILIIGNWNQIKNCNSREKNIKEKTFELFRRDSRNIEIITYDKLYERAKFITKI